MGILKEKDSPEKRALHKIREIEAPENSKQANKQPIKTSKLIGSPKEFTKLTELICCSIYYY